MPCMGPSEHKPSVENAYSMIMKYLAKKYQIQKFPTPAPIGKDYTEDRIKRNAEFKEALRRLFELDSWEGF